MPVSTIPRTANTVPRNPSYDEYTGQQCARREFEETQRRDELRTWLETATAPATCICGRPLEGNVILVCSGCHRTASDCRCMP